MPPSLLDSLPPPPRRAPLVRLLLRWRWVLLVLGPLVTFTVRYLESRALPQLNPWLGLVVFSLLAPLVGVVVLTRLAAMLEHRLDEETRQEAELVSRQRLTHQLAQCQEWDELVRFLVQFPATLAPTDLAELFTYDMPRLELHPVAEWTRADGARLIHLGARATDHPCYTCQLPRLRHTSRCEHQPLLEPSRERDVVCIPLAYEGALVGLLRFQGSLPEPLSETRRSWLDELAPEMALALVRLIRAPEQLAQARTDAQTYERRKIARTLHNSLAQQIGFLHLTLDRLAGNDRLIESDGLRSELAHMRDVASEAYARIRDTLAFLRVQEQADVIQAIKTHAQGVVDQTGLQIEFAIEGEPVPVTPEIGSRVFGLAQETLNNITRHAQASRAHIRLVWQPEQLDMLITDDGVGFDTARPAPEGHYGLLMMRESVEELGGQLIVDGAPGQGACLHFVIPVGG